MEDNMNGIYSLDQLKKQHEEVLVML